ncbi:unnamed protein product [Effrenium voratum]|nr:unnamed protein product [Effrenium voratum]
MALEPGSRITDGCARLFAIQRAKLLLEVHVKHQSQIQNFQDVREKRLKALENKRNRIEGSGFKHSCEFTVNSSYTSRIIGKGGEAIRAVQEKHEVTIKILDSNAGTSTVRIFGNSETSVAKARAEVEYIEKVVPVEPDQYNWIMGKGNRTIYGFKESVGLVYARLEHDSQQLLLCGTRSAVDDATALFETHLMYCPVFRQMEEESWRASSQSWSPMGTTMPDGSPGKLRSQRRAARRPQATTAAQRVEK